MAVTVTHPFVSAIADGVDATVVRPSNWNADHTITGTVDVVNGGTGASTASITSFNNITGYTAAGATGTTSTNLVFSASPTFTGTLGAAAITASTTLGVTGTSTLSGNAIISVTDNTNAALRITQLGTGDALLVEDSANPDGSPVVINASGTLLVGSPTARANASGAGITPQSQIEMTNNNAALLVVQNFVSAPTRLGGRLILARSMGTPIGSNTLVTSGEFAGTVEFNANDGTNFINVATIAAAVDGTSGTNDMPGRLIFSTTADGAATSTERMRINSSGTVSIASTTEQSGTTGAMTVAGGVYVAKILTAIGGISGGTF